MATDSKYADYNQLSYGMVELFLANSSEPWLLHREELLDFIAELQAIFDATAPKRPEDLQANYAAMINQAVKKP